MTDHLIESFTDGIATLTMNRPEARNAFSDDMLEALHSALQRHAVASGTRLVVLTGAGGAFSAGGDVKGFAVNAAEGTPGPGSPEYGFDARVHRLRNAMEISALLHKMPKPTLAAIPGAAAGAGLSLALACDLRIATKDAKMTTAFSRVGLSGDFGGSYFLTHLVGASKARELYFTGEVLLGEQAFALGLVNKVTSEQDFTRDVAAYANTLANLPTLALGYMKNNLNAALHGSLADVLDSEAIRMMRTFQTADHKAAAQAFVKKTMPEFQGT